MKNYLQPQVISWGAPPPRGYAMTKEPRNWEILAAVLKSSPNEWALIGFFPNIQKAHAYRNLAKLQPCFEGIELTVRTMPSFGTGVWARYLNPDEAKVELREPEVVEDGEPTIKLEVSLRNVGLQKVEQNVRRLFSREPTLESKNVTRSSYVTQKLEERRRKKVHRHNRIRVKRYEA